MKKSVKLVLVALILLGSLSAYLLVQNQNSQLPDTAQVDVDQSEPVEEKEQATDRVNEENTDDSEDTPKPQPDEESAEPQQNELPRPVISYAGPSNDNYVVKSFVQSPDNGTCELVLTSQDSKIVRTSETFHQPSYKQCENFVFEASELEPGTWVAKVRFIKNNLKSEYSQPYEFQVN